MYTDSIKNQVNGNQALVASPVLYKNCKLKRKISYIFVQPNCFNRKANKNIFKGDNHFPVLKRRAFIEDFSNLYCLFASV